MCAGWALVAACAAIALLTFAAFWRCLSNGFLRFDDARLIFENPAVIGGWGAFGAAFAQRLHTPHYKPIVVSTWLIEHALFGPDPFWFHLHNVVIHALNAVLVFLVVRKLACFSGASMQPCPRGPATRRAVSGSPSPRQPRSLIALPLVVAALFAIHPLRVESVAWASERKDVRYAFFFLAAMFFYLRYVERPGTFRWLALAAGCYTLSILSKSMGITFIGIAALIDWWAGRAFDRRLVLEKIPLGLVALVGLWAFGILTQADRATAGLASTVVHNPSVEVAGFGGDAENLSGLPAVYRRWLIVCFRTVAFAAHVLLPARLAVVYPRAELLEAAGAWVHAIPFACCAAVAVIIRARRAPSTASFGITFYLLTILPALSVSEVGTNFLSDRYTYVSSLGILIALAGRAASLWRFFGSRARRAVIPFGIAGIAMVGVSTSLQCAVWRDDEALWTNVIRKFPGAVPFAHHSRGVIRRRAGRHEDALVDFDEAIRLSPRYANAYVSRANVYLDQGKMTLARADLEAAIAVTPSNARAHNSRAIIHFKQGRFDECVRDFDRAIELDPELVDAYVNRGLAHLKAEHFALARADFDRVLLSDAKNHRVINARGVASQRMGGDHAAVEDFTRALGLAPDEPIYYRNRSRSYASLGRFEEAEADRARAERAEGRVSRETPLPIGSGAGEGLSRLPSEP